MESEEGLGNAMHRPRRGNEKVQLMALLVNIT